MALSISYTTPTLLYEYKGILIVEFQVPYTDAEITGDSAAGQFNLPGTYTLLSDYNLGVDVIPCYGYSTYSPTQYTKDIVISSQYDFGDVTLIDTSSGVPRYNLVLNDLQTVSPRPTYGTLTCSDRGSIVGGAVMITCISTDGVRYWLNADTPGVQTTDYYLPAPIAVPTASKLGTTSAKFVWLSSERVIRATGVASYSAAMNEWIRKIFKDGSVNEYDPDNPYPGGDAQTDPGNGSFDYTGDTIDIPDLPSVSVTDSGFVTLYAPTASQLNALASFMWSDTFSLDSFKKLFNNPMDCILGLSIVPVNIPTSTAEEITIGNIVSTVSCNKVSQQFIEVDCGTLTVSPTKFTGSYLDYSPYTKCYIYLPFIGIQQLNIDDVMHSTVHVVYHVDILTGACVCYLKMQSRTSGGQSASDAVLYTFMGQCAESVPLSSTDFSNTLGSILSTAGAAAGVVATVASGGAGAPLLGSALSGLASSAANTALSMKPNIQRSGSMGGASGFMNIRYPYMIFDCPHTAIPGKQRVYTGYPSNKIVKLSSLSGFNVIQSINLTVSGANDAELAEIKQTLLEGVII